MNSTKALAVAAAIAAAALLAQPAAATVAINGQLNIVANAQTFGVKNLKAIHGMAPAVFDGLPAPDAIFVGGIRQEASRLLDAAFKAMRPGGRLVVNIASLEGLSAVYAALKEIAPPVQGMLVNIARGTEQLETLRFEALNPTFLLSVNKPARN